MENRIGNVVMLLLCFTACKAQEYDINKSYKGFVLKNDVEIYDENKVSWFVPTLEEIVSAENLLKDQIYELNKEKFNQSDSCPIIDKNLNKYVRQYIGYTNSNNEKIIMINMLWKKGLDLDDLDTEFRLVLDGCSYYWKVKINITSRLAYDLDINGSA